MFLNNGLTITGGLQFGAGQADPTDPYFNYVRYLLPGTGSNNATNNTFIDSSTEKFTVTRVSDPSQGSLSPYGSLWSNYFTGTAGNYIGIADNVALQFGTDNFTIEFWINLSATTGWILGKGNGGATASLSWQVTGTYEFYHSGGTTSLTAPTLALGTWYHIAAVRNGSTISLYVNGTLSTSGSIGANSMNTGGANQLSIGSYSTTAMTGYISNFRIVKGTAVYTGNFTPTTTPLSAITNTSVLTCQSNRFVDNSSNNFTVTVYVVGSGAPFIQRVSPFSPSSSYDSSVTGGSLYLDGNSDYLSLAASAQFAIATSTTPFTIEAWIYPLGAGGVIFSEQFTGTGDTVAIALNLMDGTTVTTTTGLVVGLAWYNGSAWVSAAFANTSVPLNAWTHVAAVFTGSTTKIYYNGIDVTKPSTPTPATTWGVTGDNGDTWYVGRRWDTTATAYFYGFMSDFRFVNGTAVYTANFSVPTAPLTAVANTQLLLNFRNASIIDSATINDVVTYTNAKISTVQSKFCNGSIYLYGSSYLQSHWLPAYYMQGDFTIETWVYLTATPNGGALISEYYLSPSDTIVVYTIAFGSSLGALTGSNIYFAYFNGASWVGVNTSTTLTLNTWIHVAVVRSSTTVTIYIDGSSVNSGTLTLPTTGGSYLQIGKRWDNAAAGNLYVAGYLNDIRITNGYARYTGNFTVPSTAFPTF